MELPQRRQRGIADAVEALPAKPGQTHSLSDSIKVFISYSRQDLDFVDRLQAALVAQSIEATVDRQDIERGEEWWERIKQLIVEADTIVFVLSPGSVSSDVCDQEVAFAESLNKRFLPIVARDLEGLPVPDALARLSYVFFIPHPATRSSGDFDEAISHLTRALNMDIAWIREHTRMGALAGRWESRNRRSDLLLRGAELSSAETWLTTRPKDAPGPTDAHRALVTESRGAATRRKNTAVGVSLAAALITIALAGLAYWQQGIAIKQRDAALTTQSRFLADLARQKLMDSRPVAAMLLALEGLPDSEIGRARPYVLQAEQILYDAHFKRRQLRILAGHARAIWSVAFSPDGKWIATGSADRTARVWDADSGTSIAVLRGHCQEPLRDQTPGASCGVPTLTFSPDGRRLATASDDWTARIWDARSGKKIKVLRGHTGPIFKIAISPNGRWLVTASEDNTSRLWDAVTGGPLATLKGHEGAVYDVAFSPNNRHIITASDDGTARLWDLETAKEMAVLAGHKKGINRIRFSLDGALIITSSYDHTARLWDGETGAPVATLKGHEGAVYDVAFSPDGSLVASASEDKTVRLWDVKKKAQTAIVKGHKSYVRRIAFSPDGKLLATGSRDGSVRIWDIKAETTIDTLHGHCGEVKRLCWCQPGLVSPRWYRTRDRRLHRCCSGLGRGETTRDNDAQK